MQGRLKLDLAAAAKAIDEKVAKPLGYTGIDRIDRAAQGILDLATASMAAVVKEITVERGHDVREFALFPFGGGGPLFATILAHQLRIPKVFIPPHPGNFSAIGMLLAGARIDLSRMIVAPVQIGVVEKLLDTLEQLENEAVQTMRNELGAKDVIFDRTLEMRYRGQKHTVRVSFDKDADVITLLDQFERVYEGRYGHLVEGSVVEVLDLRVGAEAILPKPDLKKLALMPPPGSLPKAQQREVFFPLPHGRMSTPIWQRAQLPAGFVISGPAVIEEFSSTTILLPGDRAEVGAYGELAIDCPTSGDRA